MLKRTSALLVLLMILTLNAKGQEQEPPFQRVIKFYPLRLYRVFPSISLAYEQRLTNRLSATIEAGYVVDFIGIGNDFSQKSGIRLREELRYYFKYKYSETRPDNARGSYLGFDLHQNSVNYNDGFGKAEWRETGFGFKFGMAEYLGRITLDYSFGVLFRYANKTPPDLWASWVNFSGERYPIIQPVISLGIGYRLRPHARASR